MNSPNRKLFGVNIILELMDYATTYFAVTELGAEEMNPVIRPMIEKGQWGRLFLLKLGAISLSGIWSEKLCRSRADNALGQKRTKVYLLTTNSVLGLVVLNNLYQIGRELLKYHKVRISIPRRMQKGA